MLTVKQVDALRPQEKRYKKSDSGGLYIVVYPSGVKSWRYNYKVAGKEQTKVYGQYPELSLADARFANLKFKEELKGGSSTKRVMQFQALFDEWYPVKCASINSKEHQVKIFNRARDYILPVIGTCDIHDLTRVKLVAMVKAVTNHKGEILNETAHRVGNSVCEVMDYAVDAGYIEDHHARNLSRVLNPLKHNQMACIKIEEAPKLFQDIMSIEDPFIRNGLMLMAHIFPRTDEIRNICRSFRETYKKNKLFVIPTSVMKMDKPHVIPISRQTDAILKELDNYTGDSDFYLNSPMKANTPISENTLLYALYRLGYKGKMTGHGFRSLASTVLNELSPFKGDAIERQLSHKEKDAVRAAYNRAEYLPERIEMMQWYSDWITQQLEAPVHK
jgi:hypothetical protein